MKDLNKHIKLVGLLYKILGWIFIIVGILVSIVGAIALLNQDSLNIASIATGLAIMIPIFGFGIFHILVGKAFQAHKSWATIAVWILAVLNLGNVPLGTALGIYSIIVLINNNNNHDL